MDQRQAAEYIIRTFGFSVSVEQVLKLVEELAAEEYRQHLPAKPGAEALLEQLRQQKIPCGIVSATQKELSQAAMERLDLPGDIQPGVPRMELVGDREFFMTQHRGVLSYTTETVDIGGGDMTVRVIGTDLQLMAMTEGELRLRGRIAAVELRRQGGDHV